MLENIRVRFAPSPTGPLHIGGVRTALFNYLFAKKNGGTFILRIEDTDKSRFVEKAENYIINSLEWCNIPFDEGPGKNDKYGPYRQSERKNLYKKYANLLIENGNAYYAFDTSEELEFYRKNYEKQGESFIYNWKNRENGKLVNSLVLNKEEVEKKISNGGKYVIRFKCPINNTLILNDEIRGKIKVNTNVLDDKIIFKSDEMPTYHLANVIDDHLMKISHVIRGEEWLPSMALHFLLYKAFDWEIPKFAHLPLILKPSGKGKLSKRDGDKFGFPVYPLEYKNTKNEIFKGYKEEGYFSEAFINMISLLGWNPGTEKEIFSLNELINEFDLKKVSKSGARFNLEKTKWFNHKYLQKKSNKDLMKLFLPILKEKKVKNLENNYIEKVISLIKERSTFVKDFWSLSNFFFENVNKYDDKKAKKIWKNDTNIIMNDLINVIKKIEVFNIEQTQTNIKKWIIKKKLNFGKVMQPLRLALVGKMAGPDLFEIMVIIGKNSTIERIKEAIKRLG